jgi:hypothetical protein
MWQPSSVVSTAGAYLFLRCLSVWVPGLPQVVKRDKSVGNAFITLTRQRPLFAFLAQTNRGFLFRRCAFSLSSWGGTTNATKAQQRTSRIRKARRVCQIPWKRFSGLEGCRITERHKEHSVFKSPWKWDPIRHAGSKPLLGKERRKRNNV